MALFCFIVCLSGSGYQIYNISYQYFSFEINTNVRLVIDKKVKPPSPTFCFATINTIKWDKLSKKQVDKIFAGIYDFDETFDPNKDPLFVVSVVKNASIFELIRLVSNTLDTISIPDLVDKYSLTPCDILNCDWVGVYHPKLNGLKFGTFDSMFDVNIYLRDVSICMSLELKQEIYDFIEFNNVKRQIIASYLISLLTFNPQAVEQLNSRGFNFMFEERNRVSEGGMSSYLSLSIRSGQTFGITYDEYQENLLPPPFDTDCRDYSKEGFLGQDNCYEKCVRRESLKACGKIMPSLIILPNETNPIIPSFEFAKETGGISSSVLSGGKTVKQLFNQISQSCEESCMQRDCKIHSFFPKLMTLDQNTGREDFGINNFIRHGPMTVATCLPQYSLIQFLTDVSSSLGFWFGISAWATLGYTKDMIAYFASQDTRKPRKKAVKKRRNTWRMSGQEDIGFISVPHDKFLQMTQHYLKHDIFL